jgi:uncharacterized protein YecE (DUF72 family)
MPNERLVADDQLSLFGSSPDRKAAVGPATVSETIAALAARLPADLRLGTSSWYFPGWDGIVYDRKVSEQTAAREGLFAYARHPMLRTVGIDRSFYKPLTAGQFAEYATQTKEDFRFLVKAPAEITNSFLRGPKGVVRSEHLLDPSFAADHFIRPAVKGLGDRCGVLLFQFSPLGKSITAEPDRFANQLYRFLHALPQGPLYAVEVRDPALLVERFFKALDAGNARYCIGVHARMPSAAKQIELARTMSPGPFVARWNLHGGFVYEQAKSRYAPFDKLVDEDPVTREALATACVDVLAHQQQAIVIINNKAEGSAPLSIFKLAERIAEKIAKQSDA